MQCFIHIPTGGISEWESVHGDGIHTDTAVIQQVIDLCARQGGGRVMLESGAVLKASGNERDYRPLDASEDGTSLGVKDGMPVTALLFARGAENVRVTGFGVIDGNMAAFSHEESRYILRGYAYSRRMGRHAVLPSRAAP